MIAAVVKADYAFVLGGTRYNTAVLTQGQADPNQPVFELQNKPLPDSEHGAQKKRSAGQACPNHNGNFYVFCGARFHLLCFLLIPYNIEDGCSAVPVIYGPSAIPPAAVSQPQYTLETGLNPQRPVLCAGFPTFQLGETCGDSARLHEVLDDTRVRCTYIIGAHTIPG
ncbi:hypothetical protein V8C42DRAFT_327766 [Trichoderma barbatum]